MHPIVLYVGSTPITSYGLMACLAFLLSFLGSSYRAAKEGWDPEIPVDLYLVCTVFGVVGTRLVYVVTYPEPFLADPLLILQIWKGGITYYGGLIGLMLGALFYTKRYRLPVGETIDLFVPFLAFGHALGRIGCFLNGCCYGVATSHAFGVVFPRDPLALHRHPTQLYEASLELMNAVILNVLWKRGVRGGRVTLTWFGLYALERFVLEFFRGDTVQESFLFGTTLAQSTALLMGVVAFYGVTRLQPVGEEELARLMEPAEEPEEGT